MEKQDSIAENKPGITSWKYYTKYTFIANQFLFKIYIDENWIFRKYKNRDVLFAYPRAVVPSCWADRPVRSLSTL